MHLSRSGMEVSRCCSIAFFYRHLSSSPARRWRRRKASAWPFYCCPYVTRLPACLHACSPLTSLPHSGTVQSWRLARIWFHSNRGTCSVYVCATQTDIMFIKNRWWSTTSDAGWVVLFNKWNPISVRECKTKEYIIIPTRINLHLTTLGHL